MKNIVKNNGGIERKYVNILGTKVLSTNIHDLLTGIKEKVTHSDKFYILTPNPELVLASEKNTALRNAMNNADFAVPDGIGLKLADLSLNIIKGRELFMELIKMAAKNNWKVFLLGGLGKEASLAAKELVTHNPKLKILTDKGPVGDIRLSKDLVDKINKFGPDILFVAFGNPKQEIFAHEYINKLNVKGVMAVGGTFRYVAGMSKLPPTWMADMGVEWLWRLITGPNRIKRIFNATVLFPLWIFLYKIKNR